MTELKVVAHQSPFCETCNETVYFDIRSRVWKHSTRGNYLCLPTTSGSWDPRPVIRDHFEVFRKLTSWLDWEIFE